MTTKKTLRKPEKCNNNEVKSTPAHDEDDNEVYPDSCHTKKEKECWKLFQKMLAKGITVSYETILRGMLTPTELRAVQKHKEIQAERLALTENAIAAAETVKS